jgi:hypothetical protein
MPINVADIELRLSGGASNTSPTAALGGAMSTVAGGRILSQSASAPVQISGVTISDAAGNDEGIGTLFFDKSDSTLQWTPPGGSIGDAVDVSAGGKFTLRGVNDTDGYLLVDVNWGVLTLEPADVSDSITIANRLVTLFDNIDKDEALAGDTEYRCFYIHNANSAEAVQDLKIWVDTDPNGNDSLAIGLDPHGVSGTASAVSSEGVAPGSVDFSVPTAEGNAINIGTISAMSYYALWLRRTVPAASPPVPIDISRIRLVGQF